MLPLMWSLALILALCAPQPNPDAYDPLLDVPPNATGPGTRLHTPDPKAPGTYVGAFGGISTGHVRSILTDELSELDANVNGLVGFELGYRTASWVDLALNLGLGFGTTWSPKERVYESAFDVLVQARVLGHVFERPSWGLYTGVGGNAVLYDVEEAGLNQAGAGPAVFVGLQKRMGPHSLIFLEGSYGPFFDFLAYRYEAPTEAQLLEDPDRGIRKITGGWFQLIRVSVGYRLTAL